MKSNIIFNSPILLKLYNDNQLKHVLKLFKNEINDQNFIGAGCDASVFRYQEGQKVLKLCHKKINFFKKFETTSAMQFKEIINGLGRFFIPIEEILYEDANVFIYTQNTCHMLREYQLNVSIICRIFRMIQEMLKKNVLLTDISTRNLGVINQSIVFFDYHGLRPFQTTNGIRQNWWIRLFRYLTKYLLMVYDVKKYEQLKILLDKNIFHKNIDKLKRYLPSRYVELLEYVSISGNHVEINEMLRLFQSLFQGKEFYWICTVENTEQKN